jgi:hypothetical protein
VISWRWVEGEWESDFTDGSLSLKASLVGYPLTRGARPLAWQGRIRRGYEILWRKGTQYPAGRGVVVHRADGRLAAAGVNLRGGAGHEGEEGEGKGGLHGVAVVGAELVARPSGVEYSSGSCAAASAQARVAQRRSSAWLEKPSARTCSRVAISCSESRTRIDFTRIGLHRCEPTTRRLLQDCRGSFIVLNNDDAKEGNHRPF